MKELLVATRNKGKLEEIRSLLAGIVDKVYCSVNFPDLPDTVEDGTTFAANAIKKAREAMLYTGLPTLADDSGLAVDALAGAPGVFSARFAGDEANDSSNNRKLLDEMNDISADGRQAAFICALAFVTPEGFEQLFFGRVAGQILFAERGIGGFGYDPLFLVDGFAKTMAELTLDEKNSISHRGAALRQFQEYLAAKRTIIS